MGVRVYPVARRAEHVCGVEWWERGAGVVDGGGAVAVEGGSSLIRGKLITRVCKRVILARKYDLNMYLFVLFLLSLVVAQIYWYDEA